MSSGQMNYDAFRAHAHRVIDEMIAYWRSLEDDARGLASLGANGESPAGLQGGAPAIGPAPAEPPVWPVLCRLAPGAIASMLPTAAPEQAEEFSCVLDDVSRVVMPGLTHWQSPGFFGFFPANISPPAVLGELWSAGLGVQGMLWATSPACTEIETRVVDWLVRAMGLPEAFLSPFADLGAPTAAPRSNRAGGGVIQGTASEATLVALLAAKRRALRSLAGASGIDAGTACATEPHWVVYTSSQAHSSVVKAAMIAGLIDAPPAPDSRPGPVFPDGPSRQINGPRATLRLLPVDEACRLRGQTLADAIAADLAAGRVPLFLCATVGTTSSGAVDALAELAPLAQSHRVWMHVDAAWAGAVSLCPEHRAMLNPPFGGASARGGGAGAAGASHALECVDSLAFNPHKWMLVNFDCNVLFVRDRRAIIDALSVTPEYLRNPASESGAVFDYRDWQVPLGRRFRSLKLWFVLRSMGLEGLRGYIREHLRLGEIFESLVRADPRFEMMGNRPHGLPLVCFRLRADAAEPEAAPQTRELLSRLNASGRAYLTHTVLPRPDGASGPGCFVIRLALGAGTVQEVHVRGVWALIQRLAEPSTLTA